MHKKYRKGVFCVVYSGKKFLLLHRKLHWRGWEFCKGGKKAKEKLENSAKREVKEETGLEIKKIKRFPVNAKFLYDKKTQRERKAKGFLYVLFSAEVKKGKVKISKKEHDGYKWCSYKEALKLLTWADQRKCLRIVAESLR